MTDQEKLREEIKKLRDLNRVYYVDGRPNLSPGTYFISEEHATLPRIKMVEVWRVEYCRNFNPEIRNFQHQHIAQAFADVLPDEPKGPTFSCIRVTGPHMQEVPA
jgi:hypothetical protein